jgi:hypothetical protein
MTVGAVVAIRVVDRPVAGCAQFTSAVDRNHRPARWVERRACRVIPPRASRRVRIQSQVERNARRRARPVARPAKQRLPTRAKNTHRNRASGLCSVRPAGYGPSRAGDDLAGSSAGDAGERGPLTRRCRTLAFFTARRTPPPQFGEQLVGNMPSVNEPNASVVAVTKDLPNKLGHCRHEDPVRAGRTSVSRSAPLAASLPRFSRPRCGGPRAADRAVTDGTRCTQTSDSQRCA